MRTTITKPLVQFIVVTTLLTILFRISSDEIIKFINNNNLPVKVNVKMSKEVFGMRPQNQGCIYILIIY